ncbi:hypothetical protein [Paenibacillus nasutitermitis]|uniref:Uncharacterized protein n=1 Tax=Paenibacillus nasutitermitis TaxID=1652958 RepID=A0A916Z1M4_9BACL|nr:hypothetical protein [Paenibacillus nasutitermitis]GGD71690.1 hypothetical protein GCM10010911_32030 [Paenibacillus nasutitermitis]
MRSHSLKMAVVGGIVALVVLFGIDLASSGIERINGPFKSEQAMPVYPDPDTQTSLDAAASGPSDDNNVGQEGARRVIDAQHGRQTDWVKLEAQRQLEAQKRLEATYSDERLPGVPDLTSDSSVNKLADGTAGMLQSVSSKGIRMIVSFFESVTD